MNRSISGLTLCLILTGCAPGCSDYSDQIGDTNYNLVRTDSRSHWVFPAEGCGIGCPTIERDVLKLRFNQDVIAVRRQVVRNYKCDGHGLESQYQATYEQYLIVLKTNQLIGPLKVKEYQTFAMKNPQLVSGIDLLEATDFDGTGHPLTPLSCLNPRPA